ncbi:hypothetical protein, partial [Sphingorhabdus sp.]|uniref:hypothetical protein n=1 Tax=Sphingorhabdus sp. TaxID=1902408 RepID=UPI00391D4558
GAPVVVNSSERICDDIDGTCKAQAPQHAASGYAFKRNQKTDLGSTRVASTVDGGIKRSGILAG